MANLADSLQMATAAVDSLGTCAADYDKLTDAAVLAGQGRIATARRLLDTRAAWMAATIARRSRPELGDAGLAATHGFLSPEAFIQNTTGSTRADARKLLAVGTILAETEAAEQKAAVAAEHPELGLPTVSVPWQAPIMHALTAGVLSVDGADAIRKGLGDIDQAVTADTLAVAVTGIVADAAGLTTDQLFKAARRLRDALDEAGIAARQKQARDDTEFTVWRRTDGKVGLHGLLAPEDGEWWLATYDALTSPRRGGVRFVDPEQAAWAQRVQDDPRTTDQIAVDGFTDILRAAADADGTGAGFGFSTGTSTGTGTGFGFGFGTTFGGTRPAVRVIVTADTLQNRAGHGFFDGNPAPIAWPTIEHELCTTGYVPLLFDTDGQCLNLGRTQRRFSTNQRVALTVRDGGCRWPGCTRTSTWAEAHHINQWERDHGRTDVADGILLCRRHHLLLHHHDWQIIRDGADYWLRPPALIDPAQTLLAMPSRNPLLTELASTPARE